MRKAVVAVVAGCMLALGLEGGALANPPMFDPQPPPGLTFHDVWEVYYALDEEMHWGPAVYYEQPVWIRYEGTARHFFIAKKHYYHYTIQGSAKVYSDESMQDLIDERPFSGIIKYTDSRNSWGWPPLAWPVLMWDYVESFYLNWVIAGVYDGTVTCKDGHWTLTIAVHTIPPIRGGLWPGDPPYKGYIPPP